MSKGGPEKLAAREVSKWKIESQCETQQWDRWELKCDAIVNLLSVDLHFVIEIRNKKELHA